MTEQHIGAEDVNDACARLEKTGVFLRIDRDVWPTRMRAATVDRDELRRLGLLENIVRHGRVRRIEETRIVFENGAEVPTDGRTLHIDCSAPGASFKQVKL